MNEQTLKAIIQAAKERGEVQRRAYLHGVDNAAKNAQDHENRQVIYFTPDPVRDYIIDTTAKPSAAWMIDMRNIALSMYIGNVCQGCGLTFNSVDVILNTDAVWWPWEGGKIGHKQCYDGAIGGG